MSSVLRPAGHSSIGRRRYWGPAVVPGPLPAKAAFNTAPVAALASLNDLAGNFGHALFDFLFPVYNMLSLLGTSDTYGMVLRFGFRCVLALHNIVTCVDCTVCKTTTFVFVVLQECTTQIFSFF